MGVSSWYQLTGLAAWLNVIWPDNHQNIPANGPVICQGNQAPVWAHLTNISHMDLRNGVVFQKGDEFYTAEQHGPATLILK